MLLCPSEGSNSHCDARTLSQSDRGVDSFPFRFLLFAFAHQAKAVTFPFVKVLYGKKISRDESQPLEKSMRTVSQALAAAELATYQFAISDISVPVP